MYCLITDPIAPAMIVELVEDAEGQELPNQFSGEVFFDAAHATIASWQYAQSREPCGIVDRVSCSPPVRASLAQSRQSGPAPSASYQTGIMMRAVTIYAPSAGSALAASRAAASLQVTRPHVRCPSSTKSPQAHRGQSHG